MTSAGNALPFWEKPPTIADPSDSVSNPDDHSEDPYTPAEALPPPAPREKPMGFWEHLEELRGTIIKSVVTMVIFAVLIAVFIRRFNQTLLWPLRSVNAEYPNLELTLVTQSMLEPFTMIIQLCFLGSFTLSAPFVLFYIAQFVAPALTEREMRAVLPLCISGMILFLLGSAFGFFLLMPGTIRISIELAQMFELGFMWTVGKYYSTLMWLVLGVGAAFEFPLIIVVLVWLGVLSTAFLRKYRRHAIVMIFIIAAIITPTPDPLNQTLFAIPLYLLYEVAIIVSTRIEKKRARELAAG
jgi:sec-independent protein translocase protein TatC